MSVYLRAAEIADVDDNHTEGSCICIIDAGVKVGMLVGDVIAAEDTYGAIFSPEDDAEAYWGEAWPDPKACRVLALLFAHAMHEAGDL